MYFGFEHITIGYGKKRVINDMTMEFPEGKIITIIGPNGSGKSSLLKTVSKAVVPKSGKVLFGGRELKSYPPKLLAQKIGYLAQVHTSPPDIDVRTLVSYGRYPYTRLGRGLTERDREVIDRSLELTGLSGLEKQLVATLSGGERQRAWIAMTICQEPEILILDEPTTYLDISYQVEVLELVQYLNRKLGITIVMVLHDLNLAAKYSDYLYALKDGEIYARGTAGEILTEENLEKIFSIEASVREDENCKRPFFLPIRSLNNITAM